METLAVKSKIKDAINEVLDLSQKQLSEKKINEQAINKFLDQILDFQNTLNEKTNSIIHVNLKFSEFSRFSDAVDEECLQLIRQVLDLSIMWHQRLLRFYVDLNWIRNHNIGNGVIVDFKTAVDDLKEYNQDIEDLYFNIEIDDTLNATVQELIAFAKENHCND
jgi:hypothetical protein